MPTPLPLALVRAYLDALFILARHGNTFAGEADSYIRELSHPGVVAAEFFGAIDREPHGAFETLLKQQARRSLTSL